MPRPLPQELSGWLLTFLKGRPDSAFSANTIAGHIARQDYVVPSIPEIERELQNLEYRKLVYTPFGRSGYPGSTHYQYKPPQSEGGNQETLVLVEDIAVTARLDAEAKRLGGRLVGTMGKERTAMFSLPTKSNANDFIYYAKQQGYKASIQERLFPGMFSPMDALREDAQRIRRALKKQPLRPPWAQ